MPIRKRSAKTSKLYREQRIPIVKQLLAGDPPCQRCHKAQATDVHEIKSRARGGSITDLNNLTILCRPCHHWITTNPKAAHEQGWLKHSWE